MPAIVSDFDGTLAYFDDMRDGRYRELDAVFLSRAVPEDIIDRAYTLVRAQGFTFEKYMDCLESMGAVFDQSEAAGACEAWLASHLKVFPDVLEACARWESAGFPLYILTMGEPSFQKQKVALSGIPHTRMLVVSRDEEKVEAVKELAKKERAPVAIFDDKAAVLDMIRRADPEGSVAETFWVIRQESKYHSSKPHFPHQRTHDLRSVSFHT